MFKYEIFLLSIHYLLNIQAVSISRHYDLGSVIMTEQVSLEKDVEFFGDIPSSHVVDQYLPV